jgi:hypothetical protein
MFFKDFPPIVVNLKKTKADALICRGKKGGFLKDF